jgi:hypothetical protein
MDITAVRILELKSGALAAGMFAQPVRSAARKKGRGV